MLLIKVERFAGAGSLLCIDSERNTYRVSCEEYHLNKHLHKTASSGKANAKNIKTGEIKKVYAHDIGGDWVQELSGIVIAKNKLTGKCLRISKEEFDRSREIYCGVTKNKAPMIDLVTGDRRMVSEEERKLFPDRFTGITVGVTAVNDVATGKRITITSEDYLNNKSKFSHFNSGTISVYDIRDGISKKITREQFEQDRKYFSNTACSVYWEFNGEPVATREILNKLYKQFYGKNLPRIRAEELDTVCPLIKVIKNEN